MMGSLIVICDRSYLNSNGHPVSEGKIRFCVCAWGWTLTPPIYTTVT